MGTRWEMRKSPNFSEASNLDHPQYRADIDGLRAIAVLSVVGFHAFPFWFKGGFIGVDIFFVISGFLISTIIIGSLERNSFSFVEFYSRRIKRIFPALLLVLIACFGFGWFVLLADEYEQLGKHIAAGAGFASNFVLWSESGYFDNAAETKPLLHLWSLSIEEQFYIVWPLLLWAAWKKRFNLLTIILLVAFVSFVLNIMGILKDAVAAFYSPQTRFWELLAGSTLAWVSLYMQSALSKLKHKLDNWLGVIVYAHALETIGKKLRNVQSLFGGLLIAIAVFVITKEKSFPGWWALLPTLGAVLIISAGAHAWLNRTLFSNRILVWFGLISYPLYLWHWPLLSFARVAESETPSREIRIAAVGISILFAWLTYRLVEKPIRLGPHRKIKTAILVTLIMVVGYVGLNCWQHEGLKFRQAAQFRFSMDPTINAYATLIGADSNYISNMKNDRQAAIRAPYCHLNKEGQTFSEYKLGLDKCLTLQDNKKNILVLGDSHAADLYVALTYAFSSEINFLQATGAGCFPDANFRKNGRCGELIDFAIGFVKNHKVDSVVLAGRWEKLNIEVLNNLIGEIKPYSEILLVGPPVSYTDDVKNIVHRRSWRMNQADISRRYRDQAVIQVNNQLALAAKSQNIRFIDRVKVFCNEDGSCPLISPEGDLYTEDHAHLLRKGAYLLGLRLKQANISF